MSPRLLRKRLYFLQSSTLDSFPQLNSVELLAVLERFITATAIVNAAATIVIAIRLLSIRIEFLSSVARNSVEIVRWVVVLPNKITLLHLSCNV